MNDSVITAADWQQAIADSNGCLDLIDAQEIFFDLSEEKILDSFIWGHMARAGEISRMPDNLFQAYFPLYSTFILQRLSTSYSDAHEQQTLSSAIVDYYICLIEDRPDIFKGANTRLHETTLKALNFLIGFMDRAIVSKDVYGDYTPKLNKAIDLINNNT